jgi:hypothetical protein
MEGEIVREWSLAVFPVKMLPGGSLMAGLGYNPDTPSASPDTLELVQVSYEGETEWTFSTWDDAGTGTWMARQHHDFQREGNPVGYYAPGQNFVDQGKTLVLAHENLLVPAISPMELQDDVIYEVNWDGSLSGFVWRASDHVHEFGFDAEALGAIYANPNYDETSGMGDWLHINTMSELGENPWYDAGDERFNPRNLIVGSRQANFLAIISKQTGEVVWRVGPDFSDGMPEAAIGQLLGPHHAHLIPSGLPGAGNILVFDNGASSGYGGPDGYPEFQARGYSRVVEFDPITLQVVWQYGGEGYEEPFFSAYVSSAQRLPNGNTLIAAGEIGRMFEVTEDKRIVWDIFPLEAWWIYRAYRIPPEWLPRDVTHHDDYNSWNSDDRLAPRMNPRDATPRGDDDRRATP